MFPCLADQPYTSAVNFRAVTAETAMATVALGTDGKVCIFTSATTHVIVDLVASYGTPGSLHALTASPALDQTYRPGQLDHSLHCPAGGGDITITVDAPLGSWLRSAPAPRRTDARPGSSISTRATRHRSCSAEPWTSITRCDASRPTSRSSGRAARPRRPAGTWRRSSRRRRRRPPTS
ncbi:MAG: hypothetical protein R2715_05065 [Ilumatobacteraceae bacterium]